MNEGLVRLKVLDRKKAEQERLLAYGRETGNDSYRQAYDAIRQIVAKRHDAVYHQQAIYEALMLGTEFSKVPDTDELLKALESGKKKAIDEAVSALRTKGAKFFNKDYSPEVDRKVSKQLIALYARLVPSAQHIGIFKVINERFGGNTDAFVDACFDRSIFSSPEALEDFLAHPDKNQLENDLMVQYACSVKEGYRATGEEMKAETNAYNRAHKTWVAGMLALKQKKERRFIPMPIPRYV